MKRDATLKEKEAGHLRYEKIRKLNVREFFEIHELNIRHGHNFDSLIDNWPVRPSVK